MSESIVDFITKLSGIQKGLEDQIAKLTERNNKKYSQWTDPKIDELNKVVPLIQSCIKILGNNDSSIKEINDSISLLQFQCNEAVKNSAIKNNESIVSLLSIIKNFLGLKTTTQKLIEKTEKNVMHLYEKNNSTIVKNKKANKIEKEQTQNKKEPTLKKK